MTRAGIELVGRRIRYAEVTAQPHGAGTLRRLGTCDFDFDAGEAILGSGSAASLEAVLAALGDVFAGTTPDAVVVVAHPPHLVSFFSPLEETLSPGERYAQLQEEAALLADVTTHHPVRVRAEPVPRVGSALGGSDPTDRTVQHHVLHMPEAVHARLALVTRQLGAKQYDLTVASRAAARLPGPAAPEDAPLTLLVGAYPHGLELAVLHERAWQFSHYAPGDPASAAYVVLATLERLGWPSSAVGRVGLYGETTDPDSFYGLDAVLGVRSERIDPLSAFNVLLDVAEAGRAAYAPCIGGLLS